MAEKLGFLKRMRTIYMVKVNRADSGSPNWQAQYYLSKGNALEDTKGDERLKEAPEEMTVWHDEVSNKYYLSLEEDAEEIKVRGD